MKVPNERLTVDQRRLQVGLLSKGWDLTTWSIQAEVSIPTTSRFFHGRPVRLSTAYKLIAALGLKADDVILLAKVA